MIMSIIVIIIIIIIIITEASTMGELRVLIRAIIDHLLSQLVMGIVKMNIQ